MSSHLDANSELLSTSNDSYYNLLVMWCGASHQKLFSIIYALSVGPELPTTSGGESAPAADISTECDIGKLLELKINISSLSRQDKYHVDGAFCCACAIFISENQTPGGQRPVKFVANAFRSLKRTFLSRNMQNLEETPSKYTSKCHIHVKDNSKPAN